MRADWFGEDLARRAESGGFRGAVRIERDRETLLDVAHGEDAAGAAIATGSVFQLASVSKSFTAAAALVLAERGELDLQAPISTVLSGTPPAWDTITTHHLLTHTSGLEHWPDPTQLDRFRHHERAELIERIAGTPMRSPTGTAWHYSACGYVLAAHVVETIAGVEYGSALEANVLRPAGLAATSTRRPEDAALGGNAGTPVPPIDPSTIVGSGDLWSCTGDLIAWVRALEDGAVLPRERVGVMRSTLVETGETHDEVADIGYGYGWFTSTLDGHPFIWHSGDQPGYRALLIWVPQRRLTFATLTADELDIGPIVLPALRRLLFESGPTTSR